MGTYIRRDTNTPAAPNDGGTWFHQVSLADATTTANTLSYSAASQASSALAFHFAGPSGQPNLLNWPVDSADTYVAQVDVTAAGASISFQMDLGRLTNDLTTIRGGLRPADTFSGTGLKSWTKDGTTFASFNTSELRDATDRLRSVVLVSNSNMMSAESIDLRVNTTDSFVTVPWDVGAPPVAQPTRKTILSTVPATAAHRAQW